MAVNIYCISIYVYSLISGYVFEYFFTYCSIIAHDYKHRRRRKYIYSFLAFLASAPIIFFVVLDKLVKGYLKKGWKVGRSFRFNFFSFFLCFLSSLFLSLLREFFGDVLVNISEYRFFKLMRIIESRQERNLYKPTFNGIYQTKITNNPREKRVFNVA